MFARAVLMVRERFDDAAVRHPTVIAFVDHAPQFGTQRREPPDPAIHFRKMMSGDPVDVVAGPFGLRA